METKTTESIDTYRNELSVKMKNGANFILSGAFSWIAVAVIYMFRFDMKAQAGIAWVVGFCFLPFAFLIGKLCKIPAGIKENPLNNAAGLMNAAQFLYMPLLGFILVKYPDIFIVALTTVTAAHLFLFGWIYNTKLYYIFPWIMVSVIIALAYSLPVNLFYIIPLAMFGMLSALGILLIADSNKKAELQRRKP
jgi:hypothetical protein